jgi:hypothetical protein
MIQQSADAEHAPARYPACTMEDTSMLIVIAGSVIISSLVSSVLLYSALITGKRGDHWPDAAHASTPAPSPSPQDSHRNRRLPNAGVR